MFHYAWHTNGYRYVDTKLEAFENPVDFVFEKIR